MSVLAAFHSVGPDVRRHGHGLRAAVTQVLDRLTASPLDNTVLGAMGTPRPTGPRAHRHPVPRPDGATPPEVTGDRRPRAR
ncbi:hypothetical protein ACFU7Y_14495 [Kitasatospora sp. NPDC057542]|uniref:hypothetical protein n=1 Tax=Streptomycetaceae TaxID=2062 RepID=UPI001CCAAD37|nr:hypothetical protein [Streptomyces sp. LS1784]